MARMRAAMVALADFYLAEQSFGSARPWLEKAAAAGVNRQ